MPQAVYTSELAERVCAEMATGKSLRQVARELEICEATVRKWVLDNRNGFSSQYARARELQIQALEDELREIADSADDETNVQSARLRVDTRKWIMSKIAPKKYGDKLAVGGSEDLGPVILSWKSRSTTPPETRP